MLYCWNIGKYTHTNDVTDGDGQADDEGREGLGLGLARVTGAADNQDEDHSEEKLDAQSLDRRRLVVEGHRPEERQHRVRGQGAQNRRARDRARALRYYVEDRSDYRHLRRQIQHISVCCCGSKGQGHRNLVTHLADGEEAERHGRVNVSAGYVADGLDGRGDGQPEGEADGEHVLGHGGAAAEEVEQQRAQELGDERPEEAGPLVRQLLHAERRLYVHHLQRKVRACIIKDCFYCRKRLLRYFKSK